MFNYPENHNNIVRIDNIFICKDCGQSRVLNLDEGTMKIIFAGNNEAYHRYDKEISIGVNVKDDD